MAKAAYFQQAREILERDAARGLPFSFADALGLYRMCRRGFVFWRNTVDGMPVGLPSVLTHEGPHEKPKGDA